MRPSKEKMHANTSIFDPSFVYRQDGYELSYAIVDMIPERKSFVKEKFSLREFRREKTNQAR